MSEVDRVWNIHNEFLQGPYTEVQREVHQLRAENSRLASAVSEVWKALDRIGHNDFKIERDDVIRLVAWMAANVPSKTPAKAPATSSGSEDQKK